MKNSNRNTKIEFNRDLVSQIVYAIVKAVSEDVPQYRHDHHLETNNAANFIVGDYINENLHNHVANCQTDLHPFNRFNWSGRLLIDSENKVTYSVVNAATLAKGPKKHGNNPYYIKTLLTIENSSCKGYPKQLMLAGFDTAYDNAPFSDEEYADDFNDIMRGKIGIEDGYRHYIIVYTAKRSEVTDIQLLYLDPDFNEVDSIDLTAYITPDFAQLTNTYTEDNESAGKEKEAKVKLQLKKGVVPRIRAAEEEA